VKSLRIIPIALLAMFLLPLSPGQANEPPVIMVYGDSLSAGYGIELNAGWVKTSTGYGTGGSVDADLKLMRQHTPTHIQVKSAGGVRTLDRLLDIRALGVTRLGASRTKDMLDECRRRLP